MSSANPWAGAARAAVLRPARLSISIERLDILGKEPDGRAGCLVSVEDRIADQGQVDGLIGFEERMSGVKIEEFACPNHYPRDERAGRFALHGSRCETARCAARPRFPASISLA